MLIRPAVRDEEFEEEQLKMHEISELKQLQVFFIYICMYIYIFSLQL